MFKRRAHMRVARVQEHSLGWQATEGVKVVESIEEAGEYS
jgi:hypothetical protein